MPSPHPGGVGGDYKLARTIAIELNEALHKLKEQEQEIARLKRELRKYQLMVTWQHIIAQKMQIL